VAMYYDAELKIH